MKKIQNRLLISRGEWGVGGWGGGSEGWVEGSRVGRVEGERSFEAGIRRLKSMGDTLKIQIS